MRHVALFALASLTLVACGPPEETKQKEFAPVVPNANGLIRLFDDGLINVTVDLDNAVAFINNGNDLPAGVLVIDRSSEVPAYPLSDAYTDKRGPSTEANVRGFYCGMRYEARVWIYNNAANAVLAIGLNLFGANLYEEVKKRQWIKAEYVLYGQISCN